MTTKQKFVLIVSILASFTSFLDGTIVNVALPAIAKTFHGDLSLQQWVVNAYLITLSAFILLAGSLADLFGRKKIMQVGLIGFGITSLLCAIAPTAFLLITARALQGVAGALLVPSSLALIIGNFSGRAQAKAIGSWTAWTGVAMIIGPLLGGLLVDNGSWRWVFAINIVPITITLILLQRITGKENIDANHHIDALGAGLCTIGLSLTVYALIEQPHKGWGNAIVLSSLIIGIATLLSFFAQERRIKHPMLPLGLFRVRNFLYGNLATIMIYAGLSIATFIIVLFMQQVAHYSATESGLALLPVTIIMITLSSRWGALAGTFGPRIFMTLGPLVAAGGFLLMMISVHDTISYTHDVLPGIILFGLGLSMTVAPLTAAVLADIPSQNAGTGSAINNAVARVAGLLAVAAIGPIVAGSITTHSFQRGLLSIVILLVAGGCISYVGIRSKTVVQEP